MFFLCSCYTTWIKTGNKYGFPGTCLFISFLEILFSNFLWPLYHLTAWVKKKCHSVWQICLKNLNFGKWQHNIAASENLIRILFFIFKRNIRVKDISYRLNTKLSENCLVSINDVLLSTHNTKLVNYSYAKDLRSGEHLCLKLQLWWISLHVGLESLVFFYICCCFGGAVIIQCGKLSLRASAVKRKKKKKKQPRAFLSRLNSYDDHKARNSADCTVQLLVASARRCWK